MWLYEARCEPVISSIMFFLPTNDFEMNGSVYDGVARCPTTHGAASIFHIRRASRLSLCRRRCFFESRLERVAPFYLRIFLSRKDRHGKFTRGQREISA